MDKEQLLDLMRERDFWKNQVTLSTQDYRNLELEIESKRLALGKAVIRASALLKRVNKGFARACNIRSRTETNLGYLYQRLEGTMALIEDDSNVAWKKYLRGDIRDFDSFLNLLVHHRKQFHMHKIKSERLANDLRLQPTKRVP